MEEIRLVIKKIPSKFKESDIKLILDKSIKDQYYDFQYSKPSHKYNDKYNNFCFITVKNLETRLKLTDFLESYSIIDKKGMKHYLDINIAVIQTANEAALINDEKIGNTFESLLHFQKFKEAFESEDLVKFKLEDIEDKFNLSIFDNVEEVKIEKAKKSNVVSEKPEEKKKILMKKKEDTSEYNNQSSSNKYPAVSNANSHSQKYKNDYYDNDKQNEYNDYYSNNQNNKHYSYKDKPYGKNNYNNNYKSQHSYNNNYNNNNFNNYQSNRNNQESLYEDEYYQDPYYNNSNYNNSNYYKKKKY